MADLDRETLFANEALVIGMLQAVSGGSIVAALSQLDTLFKFAGRVSTLFFISAMAASLVAAVLAAYWKHQYKMWDLKASAAHGEANFHRVRQQNVEAEKHLTEAARRERKSSRRLKAMRVSIPLSVALVILALAVLVASAWRVTP